MKVKTEQAPRKAARSERNGHTVNSSTRARLPQREKRVLQICHALMNKRNRIRRRIQGQSDESFESLQSVSDDLVDAASDSMILEESAANMDALQAIERGLTATIDHLCRNIKGECAQCLGLINLERLGSGCGDKCISCERKSEAKDRPSDSSGESWGGVNSGINDDIVVNEPFPTDENPKNED